MKTRFYYRRIDRNGIECVEEVDDCDRTWDLDEVAERLAGPYPNTIYFVIEGK